MKVFVNNTLQDLPAEGTIQALLPQLNLATARGLAIAVNDVVIPKVQWAAHRLHENDKLTIIRATQGG